MTANTLQILAPSALGPRDLLNELLNRQRVLTLYALLMLAAMVPTLVLAVVDERTLREVGIWAKPLKFMASTALFALTTAWFMGLLPQARRNSPTSRAVVWTLVWTSLFEVVYISLQAALGAPSHYNMADPFHAAMFALMALAAVLLTGTQVVLAWQIYRHSPQRPLPVATQAVLAGLVLTFVLSPVSGFILGGHKPPSGSGRPATDPAGRPAAAAPPAWVCSRRPVAGDGRLCGWLGAVDPVRDAGGLVSRRIDPRTNGTAVPSKRGHPVRTGPNTPE
mgnify:CR=1 FL=1